MRSVRVTASKDYDVLIGEGLLSTSGGKIREACGGAAALLVTDSTVNGLYGETAEQSLAAAGYSTTRYVFPGGEQSKNMETYISILGALADANLSRSDVLIALGGGVTGDVAGFAAATWLRGIKFAQIPTTLLAMVDSSVGGKTAIDMPTGKNLVGAFYQPDIVICDTSTLNTLPRDILTDGFAEIIKYGVTLSASLFDFLKQPVLPKISEIIERCVTIKRDIVAADEKDTGKRQILNFGHTIGHGIEKHSNYSISHGKAVAIGMAVESGMAVRLGICETACLQETLKLLRQYGFTDRTDLDAERLAAACMFDKKRGAGNITMVFPVEIGNCITRKIPVHELETIIRSGLDELSGYGK